jgi:hypothetical protein
MRSITLGGILNCIYHFKKEQPVEKQQQYLDLMEDGIKRIRKRSRIFWSMQEILIWSDPMLI